MDLIPAKTIMHFPVLQAIRIKVILTAEATDSIVLQTTNLLQDFPAQAVAEVASTKAFTQAPIKIKIPISIKIQIVSIIIIIINQIATLTIIPTQIITISQTTTIIKTISLIQALIQFMLVK